MILGMDSTAIIGGSAKDNIRKESRHDAIRISILHQATKDWTAASIYRDTDNIDTDVHTKPMRLTYLLFAYSHVFENLRT